MILPIQARIRARIVTAVRELYGIDEAALPSTVVQYPPSRVLGDLAIPIAFELARRLRKAPRAIAQELAATLVDIEGVARVEATPSGYLNVYLDRAAFIRERLAPSAQPLAPSADTQEKVIVEHTAINPNKAAHIGHLRNAALGDMLGRLLRFRGTPVEIQNYIDDTGVQVADVVVGFQQLQKVDLADVQKIADDAATRFDYYCWDLYARVTQWYEEDKARLQFRAKALQAIEHGGAAEAENQEIPTIARFIAERMVRCHLKTMARMGVTYDLLTWEGDILRLHFWDRAFEILREKGAVYLQDQGRLAGCWVMRIAENPEAPDVAPTQETEEMDEGDQREKVIVRSDGTVTYVGKDIAYQFWKMGLLRRDFYYRPFSHGSNGTIVWATTSDATRHTAGAPSFGGAGTTYNVIDTRQTYLQKLLKQALATMGYTEQAERAIHYAYEMVALTHATARELGYEAAADADRPFVEVSGRKGLGVKADDLMDRLAGKASHEVAQRNPEFTATERQRIGGMIATAALRYFMIKFSKNKLIAFDIDEALSFEGESGPYLQYSVVRANNIFTKLREREDLGESEVIAMLAETPPDALAAGEDGDALWQLVLEAAQLDEVAEQSIRTLELSVLAKYAFRLAQTFNAFYHRYSILNEERRDVRWWRAGAVAYFRAQMTRALDLMGCDVPARM